MEVGCDPASYWDQTPRSLALIIEGRSRAAQHQARQDRVLAWNIAMLTRTAAPKLPAPDKFINPPEQKARTRQVVPAGVEPWKLWLSAAKRWTYATGGRSE